ncbi:GntR family transcriptional regulator [Pelagibacterium xiamenense]|uniref:GntR family transcriptional regulator n=1 Tax=Pelagibacterium xiamenense TaxID=2901140 RepID=UPI001E50664A|nr:GntR family transcriptional regulator [Pelagibacterium xiamenense]MCD7059728.1 GntR family transcriptional regulator [Pelagibacterium xiamenense]
MSSGTAATMHPTSRGAAVYSGVRDAILRHALAPGTKLAEDELGGIYGVSRTIVRSALQGLAADRLVILEPNRGAFVAKPSTREAREVFEARALLEPKVAALAAEVAKPGDAARLRAHLEEEHAATRAGKDGEALVLSAKFHIGIAELAGHSIYTEFVRDLCSRSSLIIALYWKRRDTTCESHAHNALVEAIAGNRPQDAAELMTSHLVDLLSGLDLSQRPPGKTSLAEALRGA